MEIVLGADGNLWFAERYTGNIDRITPTGSLTPFKVGGSVGPGLAAATDGVWFTDPINSRIGKVAFDGGATYVPLGCPSGPDCTDWGEVAVGPDGNVWLSTAAGTNPPALGRLSADGGITVFPLPDGGSAPTNLVAGPGGVWFGDPNNYVLRRISTDGTITTFPISNPPGSTGAVALGPDGNIWFSTNGYLDTAVLDGGSVVGVTTSPFIPHAAMHWIAAGPDGNLWIALSDSSDPYSISRCTPSGACTTFAIPTSGPVLWAITPGPGMTVWFTEWLTNKIGVATLH
jgi:virginiamycin B lyase